jgi:hypothetical protein
MYFVTMEIAPAIDSSKKVGRGASMIADLVTQQQTVATADLDAMMRLGEATILPYNRSKLKVVITAIEVTDEATPKVKVVWSRKMVNGAFSTRSGPWDGVTVPTDLQCAEQLLHQGRNAASLHADDRLDRNQKGATGLMAAFDKINMNEAYYLAPAHHHKSDLQQLLSALLRPLFGGRNRPRQGDGGQIFVWTRRLRILRQTGALESHRPVRRVAQRRQKFVSAWRASRGSDMRTACGP